MPQDSGESAPTTGDPLDLTIGVVGAGTMGGGIAQVAATAGNRVILTDVSQSALDAGLNRARGFIDRGAEKGQTTVEAAEAAKTRLAGSTSLEDLADVDVVIEAAPEDLDLKQDLFLRLEGIVDAEAILATNTSTLSVAAIAGITSRPGRVCGMHFFNPAPLMPLVEVIRGFASRPEVIETAVSLARAWGKTPIVTADTPGFIVNRVARPYYGEALRLLGEGVASVQAIDRLAEDAGFPMGPFALMDLIGIDVNLAAAESVYEGFFHEARFRPHPIQRRMVASGRLGRKTGEGYYRYEG